MHRVLLLVVRFLILTSAVTRSSSSSASQVSIRQTASHYGSSPQPSLSCSSSEPAPSSDLSSSLRPLSGKAPRAPRKGSEIEPSPLRPHVAARDRLQAWKTPYSMTFDADLSARFPADFCEKYFQVLSAATDGSTKDSYAAGLLRFTQFCDEHKVPEKDRMPASATLLSAFISHFAGKKSGSVLPSFLV